ncbi:uncharacterized protein RSE6_08115 [Rhynchosporium secalis]|uniref:Uncharacterized protein n=1 Tax=Rhynchosporium secalis TaxID=38038 RepID=A0A1E1MEL0_RHYSE|nr:uncharacterized protein RSE6_08115 [Rhynchosporium secalis]
MGRRRGSMDKQNSSGVPSMETSTDALDTVADKLQKKRKIQDQDQLHRQEGVASSASTSQCQNRPVVSAVPTPSFTPCNVEKEVSEEEVLRVAILTPLKRRNQNLPTHFDQSGRLKARWLAQFQTPVARAQEEARLHRAQAELKNKKHRARVEGGRFTKEKNIESESSQVQNDVATSDAPLGIPNTCKNCQSGIAGSKGAICLHCHPKKSRISSRGKMGNTNPSSDSSGTSSYTQEQISNAENTHNTATKRSIPSTANDPASQATSNFNVSESGRSMPDSTSSTRKRPSNARKILNPAANKMQQFAGNSPSSFVTSPKFGQTQLDDDEIRRMLDQLSALLLQYTSKACGKPLPVYAPTTFLNIPCIRDENLARADETLLLRAMRQLLDVPTGISVRDKIRSLQIEPEKSVWIGGLLVYLIKEFVFTSKSPFEDTSVWVEGLTYLGYAPHETELILQDNRIRSITSPPQFFASRLAARKEDFIRRLNATMMPLVGCDSETNGFHIAIASQACSLNTQLSAHIGKYEPIFPKTGELFDYGRHELDGSETHGPMRNAKELFGTPVLLTAMFGLKAKTTGKEWRTCVSAKVRMWPVKPATTVAGKEVEKSGDGGERSVPLHKESECIDLS